MSGVLFAAIQRRISPKCGVISTAKATVYSINVIIVTQVQILVILSNPLTPIFIKNMFSKDTRRVNQVTPISKTQHSTYHHHDSTRSKNQNCLNTPNGATNCLVATSA
jgi:hypothetical protein